MSAGPRPSRPPAAHSTEHSGDVKLVLRNLVRPRCSSKVHTACRCEEDTMPTVSAMPCGAGGAHELVLVWLRGVRCHLPPTPPMGPTKAGRGAYPRPQGHAPHCGHQVRMKPGHSCRQSRGQDRAAPAPGAPFTSAVLGTVGVAPPGCGERKGQAPRVARPMLGTQGPRGCEGGRPTSRWLLDWWDSSRRSPRCLLTSSWSVVSLRISPNTWKRKVWEEEDGAGTGRQQDEGQSPPLVKDAGNTPGRCAHCLCETGGGTWGHRSPSPPHLVCFPTGPAGLSLCPGLRIIHSPLGEWGWGVPQQPHALPQSEPRGGLRDHKGHPGQHHPGLTFSKGCLSSRFKGARSCGMPVSATSFPMSCRQDTGLGPHPPHPRELDTKSMRNPQGWRSPVGEQGRQATAKR